MLVDSYEKANWKCAFNCCLVLVLISQENHCVGTTLGKGFHRLPATSFKKIKIHLVLACGGFNVDGKKKFIQIRVILIFSMQVTYAKSKKHTDLATSEDALVHNSLNNC